MQFLLIFLLFLQESGSPDEHVHHQHHTPAPEEEVVFIDTREKEHTLTYGQLLEKVLILISMRVCTVCVRAEMSILYCSVVDPERFVAALDTNFLVRVRKRKFFKILNYFFQNVTKLVMCNFLSKNEGGEVRDEGRKMKEEEG